MRNLLPHATAPCLELSISRQPPVLIAGFSLLNVQSRIYRDRLPAGGSAAGVNSGNVDS